MGKSLFPSLIRIRAIKQGYQRTSIQLSFSFLPVLKGIDLRKKAPEGAHVISDFGLVSVLVLLQLHKFAAVVHEFSEAVKDKGSDPGQDGTEQHNENTGDNHIRIGVAVVSVAVV